MMKNVKTNETGNGPVRVALIGAGNRGKMYTEFALKHPDKMKVVAVAEPNYPKRLSYCKLHDIASEKSFDSYQKMAECPYVADAIINCTMDSMHIESSMPFLRQGYDMLLEKPISADIDAIKEMIAEAEKNSCMVMVCHVLRYSPFYQKIKELCADDEIGNIVAIHSGEHVAYDHYTTAFVRGKWNVEDGISTPMILAKCCHDLDILAWLAAPSPAVQIASFGGRDIFSHSNFPKDAGSRCLKDCKIESNCPYSAKAIYIEQRHWGYYAWENMADPLNSSTEDRINSLKNDNPHGRCVWQSDNNVIDHQTLIIQFENNITASFDLFCATAIARRPIHIVGTRGEIIGNLETGIIELIKPDRNQSNKVVKSTFDISVKGDMHGGGDYKLVEDFINSVKGLPCSLSLTRIQDSIMSHQMAMSAQKAMLTKQIISII